MYYIKTSTAGEYLKATVEDKDARTYVIDHLTEDTPYDIKLQSFTIDAASEFSEIKTQKTERKFFIPLLVESIQRWLLHIALYFFLGNSTRGPSTTEPTTSDIDNEANEPLKSSNQLYVTLGAALGGLALLLMLCLGIYFCNKHRHTSSDSQGVYNVRWRVRFILTLVIDHC